MNQHPSFSLTTHHGSLSNGPLLYISYTTLSVNVRAVWVFVQLLVAFPDRVVYIKGTQIPGRHCSGLSATSWWVSRKYPGTESWMGQYPRWLSMLSMVFRWTLSAMVELGLLVGWLLPGTSSGNSITRRLVIGWLGMLRLLARADLRSFESLPLTGVWLAQVARTV